MSRVLNEEIETVGHDVGGQPPPSEAVAIGVIFGPDSENPTLRRVRDAAEVQVIVRTLQHTGWNRKRAAALLKISYRGLLYKIRRHSITPSTVR
jgi:DNA-binding NtrC family response regulator